MFDVVGRGLLDSQLSFCDIKVRGSKIPKLLTMFMRRLNGEADTQKS